MTFAGTILVAFGRPMATSRLRMAASEIGDGKYFAGMAMVVMRLLHSWITQLTVMSVRT